MVINSVNEAITIGEPVEEREDTLSHMRHGRMENDNLFQVVINSVNEAIKIGERHSPVCCYFIVCLNVLFVLLFVLKESSCLKGYSLRCFS